MGCPGNSEMKIRFCLPEGKLVEEVNQLPHCESYYIYLPKRTVADVARALADAAESEEYELYLDLNSGQWELRNTYQPICVYCLLCGAA